MSKMLFNNGWLFRYLEIEGGYDPEPEKMVCLPHDACISLERSESLCCGEAKGYYRNVKVQYIKRFEAKDDWKGKEIYLQFDGVYRNAMVFVNSNYAGGCHNGYQRFYINITKYLRYGSENSIVVRATTGNDSRWYSGAGIYRNVYLIVKNAVHFELEGVKVKTREADQELAVLEANLKLVNKSLETHVVETVLEFIEENGITETDRRRVSLPPQSQEQLFPRIYIRNPKLWNIKEPNLYRVKAYIKEGDITQDETGFEYGVRVLSADPVRGFQINHETINLNGGCIHHDNGIVGSAAYSAAENRKIRLLKEAGYNAIRCAHNPMSDELLSACDRYGMIVMNELSDVWNRFKNSEDHSSTFMDDWEESVLSMVNQAYNHPCVAFYSIGNEISELGFLSGRRMCHALANRVHMLDDTRFITLGINGFVSIAEEDGGDFDEASANDINAFMTEYFEEMAEMQCAEEVVEATREVSEAIDVVGYNYAEDKPLLDINRFTNRVCIGTETFPKTIAKNWNIIMNNPEVIGDFSWAAWDYLGEAGIGRNGEKGNWSAAFYEGYPYRLANCGDYDITGFRRPQSYYRECVVGKRIDPYIAVVNPKRYGEQIDMTPWNWTDAVSNWTWKGYEGKKLQIEVYGVGDEVELLLNGKTIDRQIVPQCNDKNRLPYCTKFEVTYQPGVLKAVLYKSQKKAGEYELQTASEENVIQVTQLNQNEDIVFFMVALTDDKGVVKPDSNTEIEISVTNGGKLIGFGSADPVSTGNYCSGMYNAFYGKALLAVKPTGTDKIEIKAKAYGYKDTECEFTGLQ